MFIEMTVTDQIKIIDSKIKANQAQYDLDRLTAKISALSSGELRKYEYQDGTEGMKGLKLPGEIESKDEKSQMYLENNLKKIKNNFSDTYDKYQRFLKYIANKEKNYVVYKILSSKVDDISFCDRYGTLNI